MVALGRLGQKKTSKAQGMGVCCCTRLIMSYGTYITVNVVAKQVRSLQRAAILQHSTGPYTRAPVAVLLPHNTSA